MNNIPGWWSGVCPGDKDIDDLRFYSAGNTCYLWHKINNIWIYECLMTDANSPEHNDFDQIIDIPASVLADLVRLRVTR